MLAIVTVLCDHNHAIRETSICQLKRESLMNLKPDQLSALSLGYSNMPHKSDEVTLAWESDMCYLNTETSLTLKLASRNYPHTPEQISKELRVDEEGSLWWLKSGRGRLLNKPAGVLSTQGYIQVNLNNHTYLAHILCFCLYYDRWPILILDHINGVKTDNRKNNLREVTRSENGLNTFKLRPTNTSGQHNVKWFKPRKLWVVQKSVNGHVITKYFKHFEDAVKYRNNLFKILNIPVPRHNA